MIVGLLFLLLCSLHQAIAKNIQNMKIIREKGHKDVGSKLRAKPHKVENPNNPLLIELDQSEISKTQNQKLSQ